MILDICLSPALFPYHKQSDQIVVVIDVIRMSSSICTAFHYGAKSIRPLASIEESMQYKGKKNHLIAGERDSLKLDGFDLGNSPFDFMNESIKGKEIVITTTNGTEAIQAAKDSQELIIASFINEHAVLNHLDRCHGNILLLCSGWNQKVNVEDSLLAGKLAYEILKRKDCSLNSDAVSLAIQLYEDAATDLYDYTLRMSYRLKDRLSYLEKDIRYCLNPDLKSRIIPYLVSDKLLPLSK
jgi:2-phosphosulfolactate phosphatase